MKTETCVTCDSEATVSRKNYQMHDLGFPVELQNIEVIHCEACSTDVPVIPNMDGLMVTVATAVICNPRKLNGSEVKFLRKYVGKSATEFSRFLHVDPTHLSKIENDKTDIGDRLDKLVRLLAANMSPELQNSIQGLMEVMPNIEDGTTKEAHNLHINPVTMDYQYELA